jgi:hypothetical protein
VQESLFNVTTVWELLQRLTHEVLASVQCTSRVKRLNVDSSLVLTTLLPLACVPRGAPTRVRPPSHADCGCTAAATLQPPSNHFQPSPPHATAAGSLCCAFVGWLLLLAEFPYIQMPNDAASTASECEGGQSLVVLTQLDEQLRPCALTAPLQP